MSYLSNNIRILREQKGQTIAQLANELGFNETQLEAFETDNNEPKADELLTIAQYFGVSMDSLMKETVKPKINDCKFLVLDVDGTLTDGGMYYAEHSEDEFKKFNAKDGRAIKNLVKNGIKVGLISSGFNDKLIKRRAELLGIEFVHVGIGKKLDVLEGWCSKLSIDLNQVAFVGDDTNDMDVINQVGLSACPSDSIESVKQAVTIVLNNKGGDACVREFIDTYILETP